MLGFVRDWFPGTADAIGLDLGATAVRAAQVQATAGDLRLLHAAAAPLSADPSDAAAVVDAFAEAVRPMLRGRGGFRGRRAVLGLPASMVHLCHVRTPKLDGEDLRTALINEASAKLPVSAAGCVLKHVVAGEFMGDAAPQQEVIVLATPADFVKRLLAAAESLRLEVVGVHPPARIVVDCFARLYRRKADAEAVDLFVDLGASSARAVVAHGGGMRFARTVALGASATDAAIAAELRTSVEESLRLRAKLANDPADELTATAVARQADRLADELELCRRYYEATFPDRPISRLVFVGGGARCRAFCSAVAQRLGLPAQVGDPFVKFDRDALPPIDGLDRRGPQPDWAVAIGLSLSASVIAPAVAAAA